MKSFHLYGSLEKDFGGPFNVDVATPAEAIRALCVQLPGFEAAVRKGNWRVIRGALDAEDDVDEEGLQLSLGHQDELHLIPMIEGANNGVAQIIVGAIMIAAAFFTGGATISAWGPMAVMMGAAGVGMAVGGIITMTTRVPGATDSASGNEKADDKASFLFDGPTNQSTQGVAVPRGYGRMKVGSIVVSAGLYAEQMPT